MGDAKRRNECARSPRAGRDMYEDYLMMSEWCLRKAMGRNGSCFGASRRLMFVGLTSVALGMAVGGGRAGIKEGRKEGEGGVV